MQIISFTRYQYQIDIAIITDISKDFKPHAILYGAFLVPDVLSGESQ